MLMIDCCIVGDGYYFFLFFFKCSVGLIAASVCFASESLDVMEAHRGMLICAQTPKNQNCMFKKKMLFFYF